MPPTNLWSSLKVTLVLQRIYCLSPFYFDGKRLRSPWPVQLYTYGYLILYLTILAISVFYLRTLAYLKQFLPAGFLWTVLSGFEFAFTNASFVLVLIILEISKPDQMDFLHRVAAVDDRLQRHFDATVNFNRLKQYNGYAWLGQSFYYQGLAILLAIYVGSSGHSLVLPFVFAYQLEQATAFGLAILIVNYMLLLRARFRLVDRLHDDLWREYLTVTGRRQQDALLRRIIVLFQIFKELWDLVLLLDKAFGLAMLVRFAHDFTLLNTQLYLIFWIGRDTDTLDDLWYIAVALVWMLPNVIKIGCTTVMVDRTINEVRLLAECGGN